MKHRACLYLERFHHHWWPTLKYDIWEQRGSPPAPSTGCRSRGIWRARTGTRDFSWTRPTPLLAMGEELLWPKTYRRKSLSTLRSPRKLPRNGSRTISGLGLELASPRWHRVVGYGTTLVEPIRLFYCTTIPAPLSHAHSTVRAGWPE